MNLPAQTRHSAELTMARAGKTFYQAARLLPATVRGDVIALYAFCRTVDDLADDPARPVAERQATLMSLATALEGHARAPGDTVPGWPFSLQGRMARAAALLVRAAEGDLRQQQPATESDVLAYAFGVAGTVGIMMAEVLRAQPAGYGAAVALGMAMQLSNICRDVVEDLGSGRVYLPAQYVSAEDLHEAIRLPHSHAARRTKQATLRLLSLADELYAAAFSGMWSLPWRVRWSILAAALCYREIGVCVRKDVARSWRRRTVVPLRSKLRLIAVAALRLLHPRLWWPQTRASWLARLGPVTLAQMRQLERGQ